MAATGNSNNGSDSDSPLCANLCGFYGNPKNQNLCSVCFAAFLKESGDDCRSRRSRENSNDAVPISSRSLICRKRSRSPSAASESLEASESAADLNTPPKKIKNRCGICRRKIGLLGFECRCGDSFCGEHRYPEAHSCDVDYRAIGRVILEKQIVGCKADKLKSRV